MTRIVHGSNSWRIKPYKYHMSMRSLINLVEDVQNDFEWLYWFWFNPAAGQLVHVDGTHTNTAVFELGYWPEGRDPHEKDDLDLEDDQILHMATADGWVRGRYGKRDENQVGWNARYDLDDGDRTDMELSLQGHRANVVKAARHIRRQKTDFSTLYVDFDGGSKMEGHRLAGNRLEMFLKTGAIPSDKVMEKKK